MGKAGVAVQFGLNCVDYAPEAGNYLQSFADSKCFFCGDLQPKPEVSALDKSTGPEKGLQEGTRRY